MSIPIVTGCARLTRSLTDETQLRNLIEQIANVLDQPIDATRFPILHARLPDGTRVCATLDTVTPQGCSIAFRLHSDTTISLTDLQALGSLNPTMGAYLADCVTAAHNMLIVGATASGKTTLLNALSVLIPDTERVIRCEDTQELIINVPNTLGCEAPKRFFSQDDGGYNITLSTLIETALRQRPDRILVGEIRDAPRPMRFCRRLIPVTGDLCHIACKFCRSCSHAPAGPGRRNRFGPV